jgi:hypothetical protein
MSRPAIGAPCRARVRSTPMPAYQPEDLHQFTAAAVSTGDLAAYLALYAPGAGLAKRGGRVAIGAEATAAEIGPFLAILGTLTVRTSGVVLAGDTALLHSRGPSGAQRRTEVLLRSRSTMRRRSLRVNRLRATANMDTRTSSGARAMTAIRRGSVSELVPLRRPRNFPLEAVRVRHVADSPLGPILWPQLTRPALPRLA